jgi:hypothetical protein
MGVLLMKRYRLWIRITIVLIIILMGTSIYLTVSSASIDLNTFFSSLLLNLSASLLVGVFLLYIEFKRKSNVEIINDTLSRLNDISDAIVYFDPSYNTPDVLIGYYPNPYEEYYFKFDMYINSLKKNLELYNSFFVADFSLDEKNEKSLKEILRKENTKNENYYKIINEECDLMINELIRRKGVFEEVTECIEKDLLEDPNFLYTSNQKYSKENGYDIDRPLFEKAEKMVNSIASSISSPIFRIIKKKNDYANKLK